MEAWWQQSSRDDDRPAKGVDVAAILGRGAAAVSRVKDGFCSSGSSATAVSQV